MRTHSRYVSGLTSDSPSIGFVRSLCLGLEHRWAPERLFVFVFTGYLDESGTHGESPVTVMGGMLARAEQWERFGGLFEALQKHHSFKVFHTKKFKNRKGDFKGWKPEQLSALYWDLAALTSQGLTECVAMSLDNPIYERFYKGESTPNKVRLDSRYGLCFRQCLMVFVQQVIKRRHRKKWPHLHIVMEAGHRNYGDAERIFLEVKRDLVEKFRCDILQTIVKADKDSCGQLMMSDYIAHSTFLTEMKALHTGIPRDRTSDKIPKGQVAITHLQSTPEAMADMRNSAIEKALARRTKKIAVAAE